LFLLTPSCSNPTSSSNTGWTRLKLAGLGSQHWSTSLRCLVQNLQWSFEDTEDRWLVAGCSYYISAIAGPKDFIQDSYLRLANLVSGVPSLVPSPFATSLDVTICSSSLDSGNQHAVPGFILLCGTASFHVPRTVKNLEAWRSPFNGYKLFSLQVGVAVIDKFISIEPQLQFFSLMAWMEGWSNLFKLAIQPFGFVWQLQVWPLSPPPPPTSLLLDELGILDIQVTSVSLFGKETPFVSFVMFVGYFDLLYNLVFHFMSTLYLAFSTFTLYRVLCSE
jgi:hypothetical protein